MTAHQAFAIEVNGPPAGVAVAGRNGFIFFASDRAFKGIERRVFRRVRHVERAARQLLQAQRERA